MGSPPSLCRRKVTCGCLRDDASPKNGSGQQPVSAKRTKRAEHLGLEYVNGGAGATHSYATGGLWLPGALPHRLEIDEKTESIGHAVSPGQHHEQVRAKKQTTSRHVPAPPEQPLHVARTSHRNEEVGTTKRSTNPREGGPGHKKAIDNFIPRGLHVGDRQTRC